MNIFFLNIDILLVCLWGSNRVKYFDLKEFKNMKYMDKKLYYVFSLEIVIGFKMIDVGDYLVCVFLLIK